MDSPQDDFFETRIHKRIKLSTLEDKIGYSHLTIMDEQLKELVEQEYEEIREDQNENNHIMDETYRLFGISSFFMERKQLTCLRFDTCYHGHYYEIYYVFLKINKSSKIPPSIVAHTLPSFFPVDSWEKELLVHDIQSFTQCVSLHLNCFIARRQQAMEVEKRYSNKLEIVSSDSYCELRILFADITLKLHYHLDERYPFDIETVVTNEEKAFPQRAKCKVGFGEKQRHLFRKQTLVDVISQFIAYHVYYIILYYIIINSLSQS